MLIIIIFCFILQYHNLVIEKKIYILAVKYYDIIIILWLILQYIFYFRTENDFEYVKFYKEQ